MKTSSSTRNRNQKPTTVEGAMLKATYTTFDRSAIPTNLLTVHDWRFFGKEAYGVSWQTAVRKYAEIKGGALVMWGDGRLMVFTKLQNGKLRRKTYKHGEWGWAA